MEPKGAGYMRVWVCTRVIVSLPDSKHGRGHPRSWATATQHGPEDGEGRMHSALLCSVPADSHAPGHLPLLSPR